MCYYCPIQIKWSLSTDIYFWLRLIFFQAHKQWDVVMKIERNGSSVEDAKKLNIRTLLAPSASPMSSPCHYHPPPPLSKLNGATSEQIKIQNNNHTVSDSMCWNYFNPRFQLWQKANERGSWPSDFCRLIKLAFFFYQFGKAPYISMVNLFVREKTWTYHERH